jgi:hypothetical protein
MVKQYEEALDQAVVETAKYLPKLCKTHLKELMAGFDASIVELKAEWDKVEELQSELRSLDKMPESEAIEVKKFLREIGEIRWRWCAAVATMAQPIRTHAPPTLPNYKEYEATLSSTP